MSVLAADGAEVARGIVAYSDADAARIMGASSSEIEALLGFRGRDEMIHRDDLVLLPPACPRCGRARELARSSGAMDHERIGALMEGLGKAADRRCHGAGDSAPPPKKPRSRPPRPRSARAARRFSPPTSATWPRRAPRARADARLERLRLDAQRLEAIAASVAEVIALPDPIGRVTAEWQRPNGLRIQRVVVPLGVIGIIYESRPNVTADAGALCLKSGNAVILRGGSESRHSNAALHACLAAGLEAAGLPAACIQLVPTTDRAAVGYMLAGHDANISTSSCRAAARRWWRGCSRRRACR